MPFLLRYVTFLGEKVVAPQRLFCSLSLSEYKYLTHSKNGVKSVTKKEKLPNPRGSGRFLEQDTGIEPATVAWEATVFPLN